MYTARQWSFIGAPPLGRYPIGRHGRLIGQRERWHACAAAPDQAPTAAATRHPPPAIRRRPVSSRPRPFLVFARPNVRRSSSLRVSVSPTPPLRRALIAADATAVGDCACACATQLQPIIHYVTSNTYASLATVETFYYHRSSDRRQVAANFITKPSFLDHANRVFTSSDSLKVLWSVDP